MVGTAWREVRVGVAREHRAPSDPFLEVGQRSGGAERRRSGLAREVRPPANVVSDLVGQVARVHRDRDRPDQVVVGQPGKGAVDQGHVAHRAQRFGHRCGEWTQPRSFARREYHGTDRRGAQVRTSG
jgi:hypothetical protein